LFTFLIGSIAIIGCTPAPTFIKSNFEQNKLRTIALMPVVDKRNFTGDTSKSHQSISKIEELLSGKITDKYYDVLSPASVKNTLKEKSVGNISPENLCSVLKVDGILFSQLYDYSDLFFINHSIKMDFKIFDAKGDSLWTNKLDDSEKPFLTAIGASIGWAIGISVDSKISSNDKSSKILIGAASAVVGYAVIDAILNETSQSIDGVFRSLPDGKANGNEIRDR
jgi:hypothetical protein